MGVTNRTRGNGQDRVSGINDLVADAVSVNPDNEATVPRKKPEKNNSVKVSQWTDSVSRARRTAFEAGAMDVDVYFRRNSKEVSTEEDYP